MSNYQTISDSELQDFESSCKSCNVSPNDFKLEENNVTRSDAGNGLFHSYGELKITHKQSKKNKTYKTGDGTKWPSEFDDDLKNRFF